MASTVIGFFNNESDAREAVQHLQNDGISRSNIDMSTPHTASATNGYDRNDTSHNSTTNNSDTSWNRNSDRSSQDTTSNRNGNQEDGFFQQIGNFFSNLFDDDTEAQRYSEMGKNSTLVTVHANSTEEADRAADILDECGAVNTDQQTDYNHATGTLSGSHNSAQRTNQMGSGTMGYQTERNSRVFDRSVAQDSRLRSEGWDKEENQSTYGNQKPLL